MYGIDWDGPVPTVEEYQVSVPGIVCPIMEAQLADLKETIDPLSNSTFYGVELYLKTQSFVQEQMSIHDTNA